MTNYFTQLCGWSLAELSLSCLFWGKISSLNYNIRDFYHKDEILREIASLRYGLVLPLGVTGYLTSLCHSNFRHSGTQAGTSGLCWMRLSPRGLLEFPHCHCTCHLQSEKSLWKETECILPESAFTSLLSKLQSLIFQTVLKSLIWAHPLSHVRQLFLDALFRCLPGNAYFFLLTGVPKKPGTALGN